MASDSTNVDGDTYHPDWVAFETALGERPALSGNVEVDSVNFGYMGRELAQQWPPLDEHITVAEEVIDPESTKVRTYRPRTDAQDLPLMVYFHGGGFVSGDLDTEDPHCRILAAKTPCVVVSVDYPLAPKVTMDQIITTALRSVEWAQTHNPPLTTSPKLILAGGSAGASLATQLTHHYITTHHSTILTGLLLMFPICHPTAVTPYTGPFAASHTSMVEKGTGQPFLTQTAMRNMIEYPRQDITSPRHYPLLAASLEGWPRSYIVTAEHDPARDDGRVLAKRLRAENGGGGVEGAEENEMVREVCYEGMPHWFHWFPSIPSAHQMMAETVVGAQWLIRSADAGRATVTA